MCFLGMTKYDQDEILKLFKTGRHKIIIATSVVEEGIDIQTCNLVIKYDHVTNEIAMVQGRGIYYEIFNYYICYFIRLNLLFIISPVPYSLH